MAVEVGQQYETTATITDRTGALAAPAVVHLNVTLPNGTTTNLDSSIVNDSTGKYHADYTMTMEGLHIFVWTTIGPVNYKTDYVNANVFRSIVGIDEARDFAGYTEGDRDDIFRQVIAAATELAESIAGACVQRRYVDEIVTGYSAQVIRLPHAPLPTAASVESVKSVYPFGPQWTNTSDFIVYPDSGTVELSSLIEFWRGPWKVTYTAGRLVIPQKIQLAVKEIIYDMWSTQRPYGDDSFEPGPEDTARFEQMLASYKIPPHAEALLETEAQPGFA
jgi:hypothetical protein